jgi:hypothetical protein
LKIKTLRYYLVEKSQAVQFSFDKVKKKDLENIQINDETLMELLELPPEAFEIYRDPTDGKDILRVKSTYRVSNRRTTISKFSDSALRTTQNGGKLVPSPILHNKNKISKTNTKQLFSLLKNLK